VKKLVMMMVAALPLAAFAQGAPAAGQGAGAGPGRWKHGQGPDPAMVERVEKRMRLARTLGLAEALDLDAPQALKLGDTLAKYDDRRLALHKQVFEAQQVLRKAAQGEKTDAGAVDQAIQKAFDARAQLQAIDKEAFSAISKDLAPEKRARALLFLARFQNRFGPRHGPGMGGPGMGGPGMMRHGGHGPGGMGPDGGGGPTGMMGPGEGGAMGAMGMMGSEPGPWADDDD
jgi:hypothetical protein